MNTREFNPYSSNIPSGDLQRQALPPHADYFFQHFFYDSPLASYACDSSGKITFYNAAAVELWGQVPQQETCGWCGSWKLRFPQGGLIPPAQHPMAMAVKEQQAQDQVVVMERPDHSFKVVMMYARPVFNPQGACIGVQNTLIDVTEKEGTYKKQAILSAIVESSDSAIISKGLDGIITSWNPSAEKIFGYREDEIVGKSILMLVPEDRVEEERQILRTLSAGRRVDHLQTIRISKYGHKIPISLTVSPVKDEHGNVIGASKIARDITEEMRSQQAIKRNTENLEILNAIGRVLAESLDIEVILHGVIEATTKITGADFGAFFYHTMNDMGEELKYFSLSGSAQDAFRQDGLEPDEHAFDAAFMKKEVVRISDSRIPDQQDVKQLEKIIPGRNLRVVSYLAVPVISKSGKVIGGLKFGHQGAGVFTMEHEDLVGSIASQAAVALENSRLFEEVKALSAKKDEFIALASHELKTPITSIKGFLQISAREQKDKVGRIFVEKALMQVERLNALVADLLDSSKIVAGQLKFNLEDFDLCQLLREVLDTFHYSTRSHQILFSDPGCAYVVHGDQQRLEQVLSNLLNNAIKYSPKADKVYVSTQVDDGFVTIRIRDEGIGLSGAQRNRIFSRFYRADAPANISGLGLGLYLTKEIIDRHGGQIDVDTALEKGSEFYFSLPLIN